MYGNIRVPERDSSSAGKPGDEEKANSSTLRRFKELVELSKEVRNGANYLRKKGGDRTLSREPVGRMFVFLAWWVRKLEGREAWLGDDSLVI